MTPSIQLHRNRAIVANGNVAHTFGIFKYPSVTSSSKPSALSLFLSYDRRDKQN